MFLLQTIIVMQESLPGRTCFEKMQDKFHRELREEKPIKILLNHEVIRASSNLFEKCTHNRMGKKTIKIGFEIKIQKCWCLSNFDPFT